MDLLVHVGVENNKFLYQATPHLPLHPCAPLFLLYLTLSVPPLPLSVGHSFPRSIFSQNISQLSFPLLSVCWLCISASLFKLTTTPPLHTHTHWHLDIALNHNSYIHMCRCTAAVSRPCPVSRNCWVWTQQPTLKKGEKWIELNITRLGLQFIIKALLSLI